MLRMIIPNFLLRFLILGLAALGGSRVVKGELPLPYCCGNVTAQYLMCSSTTGCSQSMYLYECVGTGDIGANKVTEYC